jgi:hypothetical protein
MNDFDFEDLQPFSDSMLERMAENANWCGDYVAETYYRAELSRRYRTASRPAFTMPNFAPAK